MSKYQVNILIPYIAKYQILLVNFVIASFTFLMFSDICLMVRGHSVYLCDAKNVPVKMVIVYSNRLQ